MGFSLFSKEVFVKFFLGIWFVRHVDGSGEFLFISSAVCLASEVLLDVAIVGECC